MSRAVLSIGSNVGARLDHLRSALAHFRSALVAASPVYETAPWGNVEQQDFLNAVLVVDDSDAGEWEWLRRAQAAEADAGRTREVRWGPRTLDVDVINVDGVRSDHPDLRLPHPRAHERAFVLQPWLDVEPGAVLPGHGPVADVLAALPVAEREGVRRWDDTWWQR